MTVYNPNKKMLFVHIPKTAGRTIRETIFGKSLIEVPNDRTLDKNYHSTYEDCISIIPNLEDYYKFTVVRNPWDRCCSWYYFRKNILDYKLKKNRSKIINLDQIEKWKTEYSLMNKDFNEWLFEYINVPWDNTWFSLGHSQLTWIGDPNIFDKIIKYENLETEMKNLGVKSPSAKVYNNSKNKRGKYKSLFSKETRELVENIYQEDIEKFQYTF